MKVLPRFFTFLKGVCMGMADIIPGVSGGTMALIIGIYPRLVESISNINLAWVLPLGRLIVSKDEQQKLRARTKIKEAFLRMNFLFLVFLAAGIGLAVVTGSLSITYFLDNYPVLVRAFFFGLILASSWIPISMIKESFTGDYGELIIVLTAGVIFLGLAFLLTSPGLGLEPPLEWEQFTSRGESLSNLATRRMSALPVSRLAENSRNKDLENNTGRIPEGETVYIPRLPAWYLFLSAVVAICAMILPGISGAYILLILGSYYYILNVFNTFLSGIAGGEILLLPLGYIFLFCAGAASGLLVFSRLIRWMLGWWKSLALAVLTGLLLGGLHGLWPFYWLQPGGSLNWFRLITSFLVGIIIVGSLNIFSLIMGTEYGGG